MPNPGRAVFVAEDRDAAAYLLNDFYNLLDERQVYFFPSSWKRSAAYGAEDAQGVVQPRDDARRAEFLEGATWWSAPPRGAGQVADAEALHGRRS